MNATRRDKGMPRDRAPGRGSVSAPKRQAPNQAQAAKAEPYAGDAARGEPLDAAVRGPMEARFGHDFSRVRVHTDGSAADAARAAGANAFTIGSDVVFGKGEYRPHSARGQNLIAHELAHVVQQASGGATPDAERRAGAAAERVTHGAKVSPTELGGAPVSLQAQSKPDAPTKAPAPSAQATGSDTKEAAAGKPAGGSQSSRTELDQFALDSAALTDDHKKTIDSLAFGIALHAGMETGTRVKIAIVGHTDTSGPDKHNMELGQKRADAVKAALDAALAGRKLKPGTVSEMNATSVGETDLRIPTKDNVKEPRNRRVVIDVTMEGPPPPPPPPKPRINLNLPPGYQDPGPPPPYRRPDDDRWKKMQEEQRRIEEYNRTHPKENKSPLEIFTDKVVEGLDPLIKKLPEKIRDLAREGIRKGIEKGTESAIDAAVDASGATGPEADALKAAAKAALKTRPDASK
jgi:outer membrane protein OmpA-like peptidoglycan-associated protein